MANNVSTVNGVIAADEIAGIQFQRVKLVDGTEDSTTSIPGDGTNGLKVDVTRVTGTVQCAIVSGAGSGGTSQLDDAAYTPAVSNFTTVGGTYRSGGDSVDDGDAGAFAMTAKRAAHTTLRTPLDDSVMDDTANAVKVLVVDAAGATLAPGSEYTEGETDATISGKAFLWEDTSDTLRAVSAAKPLPVNVVAGSSSGTEYTEAATDASITGPAIMWEDSADTLRAVSAAKPLPVNVISSSALTQGTIAHDTADSGNPVKIGGRAVSSPAGATMVTAADRVDFIADLDGIQIVKNGTANRDLLKERVTNTNGTSTASGVFTAVASTYNCITDITVCNTHATDGTYVDFRNGTAGAIEWTMPAPANFGGSTHHFDPPLVQTSANTAFAYDVLTATTTIVISIKGYQTKA